MKLDLRHGIYRISLLFFVSTLVAAGCGSPPEFKVEGTRDAWLAVTLHLDKVFAEIERRASEEALSDPKAAALFDWRQRVELNNTTFYLMDAEGAGVEVVVVVPDAQQKIWKDLTTSKLFENYLEKLSDNTLRPKWEALDEANADEVPDNFQQLQI